MRDALSKSFYSIGEVAEILGISQSTIRYWEKEFTQLHPTRNAGGLRRFTTADIETLRIINFLVKEKGLKISAAKHEIAANRKQLELTSDAMNRLHRVREALCGLLDALDSRRQ